MDLAMWRLVTLVRVILEQRWSESLTGIGSTENGRGKLETAEINNTSKKF